MPAGRGVGPDPDGAEGAPPALRAETGSELRSGRRRAVAGRSAAPDGESPAGRSLHLNMA